MFLFNILEGETDNKLYIIIIYIHIHTHIHIYSNRLDEGESQNNVIEKD